MNEEWKPYRNTHLLVSNFGNVKNSKNGKNIVEIYRKGYPSISTSTDGNRSMFTIHRAVAELFLPRPKHGQTQVNHIDGNKLNNSVLNLEWVTPSENIRHSYSTGLSKSGEKSTSAKFNDIQVLTIKTLRASGWTYEKLAQYYIVSISCIHAVVNGVSYKYLAHI